MSNKLRNRFLALICLLAFGGVGLLFYVNWVVQKPFAIILILSDNLTATNVTAARIYQGGADNRLTLEKMPHLALLSTQANDYAVPDGASAATAMATGQKTNNRSLGLDPGGKPLSTLIDVARSQGRATGVISNAAITDAAAAAFFAKAADPHDSESIALQLSTYGKLDVILGGGEADFLPEHKNGRRKDGRDLMLEMRQNGFEIARNKSELLNTPLWRAPRLFGIFAEGNLAFADEIESVGAQPSLSEMVAQAIQLLQFNRKGYLLVVDAGLAGKAATQNEGERMLRELLVLDSAVATALTYAGENSLVIVAGRQNVGGLALNGYPFRNDKGVAVVGINPQGVPSLTWATGPGSRFMENKPDEPVSTPSEPSAFPLPSAVGVADDAIAVSRGPGSEKLSGFSDNTAVYQVISENL